MADEYLVTAKLEGTETVEGMALFFVERDAEGVSERHKWDAIGMRGTATHGINLKDVFVKDENALAIELRESGLVVKQQVPIKVTYKGAVVGEYFPDLLVEDAVILELKAAKQLTDAFTAQCLSYLKATGLPICLLFNFGKPRIDVKRLRL